MDTIRQFPQLPSMSIRDSVKKQIENIPDGHHFAVILTPTNQDVKFAALVNWGDGWSFAGFLDKQYKGPLIYGAELKWSR